jgi:hypothetical protein
MERPRARGISLYVPRSQYEWPSTRAKERESSISQLIRSILVDVSRPTCWTRRERVSAALRIDSRE